MTEELGAVRKARLSNKETPKALQAIVKPLALIMGPDYVWAFSRLMMWATDEELLDLGAYIRVMAKRDKPADVITFNVSHDIMTVEAKAFGDKDALMRCHGWHLLHE